VNLKTMELGTKVHGSPPLSCKIACTLAGRAHVDLINIYMNMCRT
jgi:hypothetical protein